MSYNIDGDRLDRVQSLVRAFGILDAVRTSEDEGMTLTEIASITKLPRSTTHRLLTTMNALSYVEFDSATNRWMIGFKAYALGSSFMQTRDLGRLSRPIMRSLMIAAGETVSIALPSEHGICYTAQIRSLHDKILSVPTGTIMPMSTTASGKAMLAFAPERKVIDFLSSEPLPRHTPASSTTANALATELQRVRAAGYAIDNEEHIMGLRCVAAPILDCHGIARASLSISGSVYRLSEQRLARLGLILTKAADRMRNQIGNLLTS